MRQQIGHKKLKSHKNEDKEGGNIGSGSFLKIRAELRAGDGKGLML
jgi:hypothetical protein